MVKTHTTTDFIPIQTGRGRKPLVARVSACRPAFTMNELMIAAAIIGIIAAITVPTLLADTNKKRYQVASDKVNLAIINALKSMRVEGNLVGHDTTENFVGELKKHMNINKICQQDELDKCFTPIFKINNEEKELKDYTTSDKFSKSWNTNVNGAVLNDGTSMLIAYNPNCSKFALDDCVSVVYDTNGKKPDNSFNGNNGEFDINTFNVTFKTGLDCGTNVIEYTATEYDSVIDTTWTYAAVALDGTDGKTQACIEANWTAIENYCTQGIDLIMEASSDRFIRDYFVTCLCFPQGTLVALADGSQKRIEQIDYDDDLLVWDFDNGKMSSSKPVWLMKPQVTTKYNILTFSDGSELRTVKRHRIFNKEEGRFTYTMEDETPLGTTTLNAKGEEVTLVSKEVVEEPVVYYNLITANHFNCFTSNILTSNRFNNLYPIVDYKFVKDDRELTPYSEYENFVSRDWYEKLRLAEQTCDEDMKLYLSNLVRLNKRQLALA